MRTKWLWVGTVVALGACGGQDGTSELYDAPAIPNVIDGVVFEPGNWEPHLEAGPAGSSWGNHRAVVVVDSSFNGDKVLATIPWRRRDNDPSAKSIVVVDATSGEPVANSVALRIENESGDVVFQPNPGSFTYHVYFLPWESTGSYYPQIHYPVLESTADRGWTARVRGADLNDLPVARTTHIQSVNDFHSFFPMEVIAGADETESFIAANGGWAAMPEHRDYPVRMRHFIPFFWAERGPTDEFHSQALRGEYLTFQVAVVAGAESVDDVQVGFDGFPGELDGRITCFNCGGTNEKGEVFEKDLSVPEGMVQPIWIGIDVPEDMTTGPLSGNVLLSSANRGHKSVSVNIDVHGARAVNHGYNSPEKQTRLAWLNSTVGTDPDFIVAPFVPVSVEGHSLSILGRTIELGASGLPEQILSFFSPEMTFFLETPEPVLTDPTELHVEIDGNAASLESAEYAVVQEARGRAEWSVESSNERISVQVNGALEYEGMLDYQITVRALSDLHVSDISLPISLVPEAAEYMLGLGFMGGKRPTTVDWKWKVENHQEGVWLGGINKGMQYVLRDENYVRPLNTNFYQNQPLVMPESWFNAGRGGIRIETGDESVTALNYSGPRRMNAGESLQFNVRFLLTPFKPLDTHTHFNTRFVHRSVPVDSVVAWGGTVVNIHHANEINPYINYPFFNLDIQTAYIEEAHAKGIKFKLYNTIRELTYRAHELFALRSLSDEILNDGEGGGHSWLQEHVESNYHSAWHAWRVDDAAVLNKGTSRWTNYYVEGLNWLAENQHIDGLYLDDIAFSRETVKRMMSVLNRHRDEVIIDLHSANQYNPRDGHINSAMLYMEHFPFVSRLWFGEYFEYDRDGDYWLTEVSGIPFGLMGEMLQDGGHPYRGLLYGMTTRIYGSVDPRPVWGMMSEFGIDESRMLGYWLDDTPVTTDKPRILATTYVRPDGLLIVLASWSGQDETVNLSVDSEILSGLGEWSAAAPEVDGLQPASDVDLSAVRVPANQGLYVLVR